MRCLFCNRNFEPTRKGKKYCSSGCRVNYWVSRNKKRSQEIKSKYYKNNKKDVIRRSIIFGINNPDKINKSRKKYYENNKDKIYSRNAKYKQNNPKKQKAKEKAQHFVPLKNSCDICSSNKNLQRHHWDYNKPLLVNTLCLSCHKIQHTKHFDNWRLK